MDAKHTISTWPEPSREAAELVIDARGEPDEVTESQLIWHDVSPWKRIVATKAFYEHNFPAPHVDAIESFIDYLVPAERFTELANFDGSVVVDRTAGEISARCHDEQATFLALNLVHDIVTRAKTADEARQYYVKEFLDHRRHEPTPYMEKLHFEPIEGSADPDKAVLSNEDRQDAVAEGMRAENGDDQE